MGVLALLVTVAVANLAVTHGAAGVPAFAFFFLATTVLVSLNTALTPLLTSRALDDVGHIAGTAASTIGGIGFIGASLLSPLVDGAIETTITPFAAGYVVFGVVAAAAAVLADRGAPGRRGPSRRQLVERKKALEGEIQGLHAEVRSRRGRDEDASDVEARLARLRDQHYRTRLEIDRTRPGASR